MITMISSLHELTILYFFMAFLQSGPYHCTATGPNNEQCFRVPTTERELLAFRAFDETAFWDLVRLMEAHRPNLWTGPVITGTIINVTQRELASGDLQGI